MNPQAQIALAAAQASAEAEIGIALARKQSVAEAFGTARALGMSLPEILSAASDAYEDGGDKELLIAVSSVGSTVGSWGTVCVVSAGVAWLAQEITKPASKLTALLRGALSTVAPISGAVFGVLTTALTAGNGALIASSLGMFVVRKSPTVGFIAGALGFVSFTTSKLFGAVGNAAGVGTEAVVQTAATTATTQQQQSSTTTPAQASALEQIGVTLASAAINQIDFGAVLGNLGSLFGFGSADAAAQRINSNTVLKLRSAAQAGLNGYELAAIVKADAGM